ncbi:MAG: hypothetical protein US11_C0001G0027 [Candidatus Roizmanbacteria bacterium GW2011_GWA2_36_23]|uniref:Uncharacterized protein n=1 Tax=Candidatus Roizmanbacteria bacterium GW2011_GWA2_36_23 TaxID=1618480 RepID=A0A0G0E5A1_9BACT|nr:MAG: hypothetical protein US11_C0001G0027 [Candidatus Roizmanbacteria bacterium GW2011_GWA2_36_23]
MITNNQGLLLCSRYSVAPNYFDYCGPDKNQNLIDHLQENIGDKEVQSILSEFDSLFLNLTLIAIENKIKDPFEKKVVEAYWVGNSLLNNVKNSDYVSLLKEKFNLAKKIGEKKYLKLQYKFLSHRVLPHHAFHVFNIFKRTGNDTSFHTLHTMDECRIGWGKIESRIKNKELRINTKPLIYVNNKLKLGNPIIKIIREDYRGKSFLTKHRLGDWISFHWGFACDILSDRQTKNLEFYTQKAIDFYNQP